MDVDDLSRCPRGLCRCDIICLHCLTSKKNLKEVVTRLEEKAGGKGMQINESKTKYVSWTDQEFAG